MALPALPISPEDDSRDGCEFSETAESTALYQRKQKAHDRCMSYEPDDFGAKRVLLVCFGILPALLLVMMSFVGLGFLRGWLRLLAPASLIGTVGMIWALCGVARRNVPIVLGMLFVGEIAILFMVVPASVQLLNPRESIWLRVFVVCLAFGPMLAGAVFAFDLLRKRNGEPAKLDSPR